MQFFQFQIIFWIKRIKFNAATNNKKVIKPLDGLEVKKELLNNTWISNSAVAMLLIFYPLKAYLFLSKEL